MEPDTQTTNESEALAQLVVRLQALDEAAFDELVSAYAPRLYGFLYRLIGRREDAEDLMQEVFVRVVRVIDRYKHDGRFDAWLFRIATNLARDRHRRVSRQPQVASLDQLEESVVSFAGPSVSEVDARADQTEAAEVLDQVQALLPRLPDAEREVILLRHYGHLTFADIANMMGTPLGTALARSHRALGKLRAWMEAES